MNSLPKILYGFDQNFMEVSKRDKYLEFHELSTKMVKHLGYETELYTNSNLFDSYFDIIHKEEQDFIFWDSYKLLPYILRDDDYMIIDYDVFFHKKIEFNKEVDFYFDTWESWSYYNDPINELTSLGISEVIPEWTNTKQKVMNTGLLYFKNKEFRKMYYERYTVFCDFCENNKKRLKYNNFQMFGTIGAQYLLTILSKYHNMSHHHFSIAPRIKNEFYHHNVGPQKFNKNIKTNISLI